MQAALFTVKVNAESHIRYHMRLELIKLQPLAILSSTDCGHSHDDHEINEVKEEFDNKTAELEMKIVALEAEANYRQYLFLSFMHQLYSISSGRYTTYAQLRHYQHSISTYISLQLMCWYFISTEYLTDPIRITAPSCSDIKHVVPNAPSGQYWIRNPMGHVSQQYCDMEREACGTRGGWMRVAHLDMTQPDHSCPPGFRTITSSNKTLCGRPGPPGCVSVKFPTYNIPYNKVSGKVIAYQDKTPDAQCAHRLGIEGTYIDGVSLTHGTPRKHIWSFIASHGENINDCRGCPCYNDFTGTRVPFIGNNFFCDSGIETFNGRRLYHEDKTKIRLLMLSVHTIVVTFKH